MKSQSYRTFKKLKILLKTAGFGVSSLQGTQNIEIATQGCSTKISVWQKV